MDCRHEPPAFGVSAVLGLGMSARLRGDSQKFIRPVRASDIVVASGTQNSHMPMVLAGAAARQGFKGTFIAMENAAAIKDRANGSDVWAVYPNDEPKRSLYAGDSRLAMAPFLAYRHFGDSFKCLLYGDDDTIFFSEGAINVASQLDHNMPIFLSDNYWFSHPGLHDDWDHKYGYHPHRHAPACLACNSSSSPELLRGLAYNFAQACPCTPQALCSGIQAGVRDPSHRGCKPKPLYSHHGGAGALISIGLLRRIDFGKIQQCVQSVEAPGGDSFIVECLWQEGFAPSMLDPLWHPLRLQRFSPSPETLHTDEYLIFKATHVLAVLLMASADVCIGLCKQELANTVSLHLRAQGLGLSESGAAIYIETFARLLAKIYGKPVGDFQAGADTPARILEETEVDIAKATQDLRKISTALQTSQAKLRARSYWPAEDELELQTLTGKITLSDRMLGAAADAVALEILRKIRLRVQPLATWSSEISSYDVSGC